MKIQTAISAIAGILFVLAYIPYIRAILSGKAKPAKASWIIWASLDSITIVGMYVQHALNGQMVGAVAGSWIVVVFALKYGMPGWSRLDKFCLAGAVVGVVLWKLFSNPTLGILISLAVVFVGSIPTFVSAWHDPSREDKLAWTLYWVSCICAVLAIPKLTFDDVSQPAVFCIIETIMMYILYIKPRAKR
ncbi:MAG: hypothetical protein ABSA74_00050 [Candidatus Staskawiczbacteria bacterium]